MITNKKTTITLFFLIATVSEYSHAYLDPASGNAIASFFIALFGSAIFFLKSVFYNIFSRSSPSISSEKGNKKQQSIPVLFSEGKTYWSTFRPIVEELIQQKKHFRFITLDVNDPGLLIDNKYMHSKRLAKNRLGFAKLANIESPLMLSTTPNIGSEGYPMQRPAQVQNLVHVFHSMLDVSCYRKGSLDFYDSVLMTGAHEKEPIRLVEKARKTKEKSLIVAGLPCLDDLNNQKIEFEIENQLTPTDEKIILIAPSWGAKGCFNEYGTGFIKTLSSAGFDIIIRLHPHSYIFEPESVEKWQSETENLKNVRWDNNAFGTKAMMQADILISDSSSIRFDFTFLYSKPVITLPISDQSLSIFESDYMSKTWADSMSDKIGIVVNLKNINRIDKIVEETLSNFNSQKLTSLREKYLANFGHSSKAIVSYINEQVEILSLTPFELKLKEQIDSLKTEIDELKTRAHNNKTETVKGNLE